MKSKEELRSIASQIYTLNNQLTKENRRQIKVKISKLMQGLTTAQILEINDFIHKYSNSNII